jgi:hypothetical protein
MYKTSYQIKLFLFMAAIYALIMALTTVYSYARLDYVRSYSTDTNQTTEHNAT